ncbi:MAG: cytidine deaminase, partial [Clostridia bacterium]|nr:cytidine deaminase [Clostridia bacterium]
MADGMELIKIATETMMKAYTPYSGFKVGAALLASSGKIYTGCNIENASYTPTVCAERVAFFSAVRDGERKFDAIAIVGGEGGVLSSYTYPCGVCRQVMRELCTGDFKLYFSDGKEIKELTLDEMMPYSFTP